MTQEIVEATGVSKWFDRGDQRTDVLDDLNFSLAPGDFTSVVGKSGSGKSTLLNLLAGIDVPSQGTVILDGTRISHVSETERTKIRRRDIGMIFQFFNLIPTLTAVENVSFPLELNDRREERHRSKELLNRLGLEQRLHRYPDTLSGGEQQRVAIARALVHEPKLVLADEPTGNLDYDHSDVVLDAFRELADEQQVAVFMATHSRECASISDRILTLREGRLERA